MILVKPILSAVLCALLLPFPATAGEFAGRVVSIQDGDSLTVLVSQKQIKVRLTDIDAPGRIDFGPTRAQAF